MNLAIDDIILLDTELAVNWNDKKQSFIPIKILRNNCPCAFCSGEKDVFGNIYKGSKQDLGKVAYEVINMEKIGHYAIRIFWGDRHSDGLYTYEMLRKLGEVDENKTQSQ